MSVQGGPSDHALFHLTGKKDNLEITDEETLLFLNNHSSLVKDFLVVRETKERQSQRCNGFATNAGKQHKQPMKWVVFIKQHHIIVNLSLSPSLSEVVTLIKKRDY